MSNEKYIRNSERVYKFMGDIMGIPNLRERGYNIHHIVFKTDIERNPGLWEGFDVNGLSNLFPLLRVDHTRLHQMADKGEFFGLRINGKGKNLFEMHRKEVKEELKRYCQSRKIKFNNRLEVNDFS